jgi:hypothetical protein
MLLFVVLSASISSPSIAQAPVQSSTIAAEAPEKIVQAQVDAYNRRDLEGFLSFYADDAKIYVYPDQLVLSGKEAMRERYAKTFEPAELHAAIPQRIAFDRFVIDQEKVVTGRAEHPVVEAVAIYEIKDGRIARVTFLRH